MQRKRRYVNRERMPVNRGHPEYIQEGGKRHRPAIAAKPLVPSMNSSSQWNGGNNGGGHSNTPSQLIAFIRAQYEQQQQQQQQASSNQRNPPNLLESLWLAGNNNHSSGESTQTLINNNAAYIHMGALGTSEHQQIAPTTDDPMGQASASVARALQQGTNSSELQSLLVTLARQQEQQRQLERQQQQRRETAAGLRPATSSGFAPLRIHGSITDSSNQLQRLLVDMAAQKQQAENNNMTRASAQPLGTPQSSREASLGLNDAAMLQILMRNKQQDSRGQNPQILPRTNVEQHRTPFDNSFPLGGISNLSANPENAGVTQESVLAGAMRQRADAILTAALLHQPPQHASLGQSSPRSQILNGLTSSQKSEYLQILQRQRQHTPGAANTGITHTPNLGRSAIPIDGQRQLELHGNTQVSGNSHDNGSINMLAPMAFAASRVLPLGTANRNPSESSSRPDSAIFHSILRGTKVAEGSDRKRKLDEREKEDRQRLTEVGKPAAPSVTAGSFPLPSLKSARHVSPGSFEIFRKLWNELEGSEMQEEIFQRRMYNAARKARLSKSIQE